MGREYKKTEYEANLEFRNRTKETIDWDNEDEQDGLIETDPGIHTELVPEFTVVLLEEDTPGPVAAVETKTLDTNSIAAPVAANSGITNTT